MLGLQRFRVGEQNAENQKQEVKEEEHGEK
jgi:hypothetical protein